MTAQVSVAHAVGYSGRPSLPRRFRYFLNISLHEPTTLIGLMVALVLAYLIVLPVLSMLMDAVLVQSGDARRIGAPAGALSGYYLDRTFASPVSTDLFWTPLVNTISV